MKNKIIVIEDDGNSQSSLSKRIKVSGYSVISVSDIIDFNHISDYQPAIIIVDDLPLQRQGNEICETLHRSVGSETPILFISGRHKIKELSASCGAQDYLQKPFSSEQIKEKIASLLPVVETNA